MPHQADTQPKEEPRLDNRAAPGASYYTPLQSPPAGTAFVPEGKSASSVPKLFQPLQIRGLTLHNRIFLSPLCQYSAPPSGPSIGQYTDWHKSHIGGIAQRGPGLLTIEASAVTQNGRITPNDVGIWNDEQIAPLASTVEFVHSQGQKIAIQLAHAGRKASTVAPWLSAASLADESLHGWPKDVYAPSAIAWDENHATPHEMTLKDIEGLTAAYAAAAKRAVRAGFDVIEIHNAHGYLLNSFLSPASNTRTDKYGGSFENRTRLTLEVVDAIRAVIPKDMPLFLRISATDWLEEAEGITESWTGKDTARLAPLLAEHGVDLLDVSSGGNHPKQHPHVGPCYQAPFAKQAKEAVGDKLLVTSVGNIRTGQDAQGLVDDGLDAVFAGRWFQKDTNLVWTWAEQLGVDIQLANQIRWGFGGRGAKAGKAITEVVGKNGKL